MTREQMKELAERRHQQAGCAAGQHIFGAVVFFQVARVYQRSPIAATAMPESLHNAAIAIIDQDASPLSARIERYSSTTHSPSSACSPQPSTCARCSSTRRTAR